MATKAQEVVSETNSFASDLAGIPSFLIDPEGAARRVRSKWFWVAPVLLSTIIAFAVTRYMTPFAMHAAAVSPLPDGMASSEQYSERVGIGMKFFSFLSPILVLFFCAIQALLLMAMAAMLGASARFGQLFNLCVGCGLIQSLAGIASAVVLHFKGEVSSMAELKPAMGLDIFMPEGANKYLVAIGASFSVFQIWWLVMMVLIFAAAFRLSKGKSFAAVFPLWLLGVGFALLGAAFQK